MTSPLTTAFRQAFQPPPLLTVDQHAEQTIIFDGNESPIEGPLNLDHTPYLRFILNEFTNPEITHIYACTGTQWGKTVFLFCIGSYIICCDPAPTLIHYPSKDVARSISKSRWSSLFRSSPALGQHLTGVEDDMNRLEYTLDRMIIHFAWDSMKSVSSHPKKYVIQDELKDMDKEVYTAAHDRTKKRHGRKIIGASSPLITTDPIWSSMGLARDYAYEAWLEQQPEYQYEGVQIPIRRWRPKGSTTVYNYIVECPHCHGPQDLHPDRIRWPTDCFIGDLSRAAWYLCAHCNGKITDRDKRKMIRAGVHKTRNPGSERIAFHMGTIYSIMGPDATFGELAAQYLRTFRSKPDLKAVVNGYFAYPWEEEEYGESVIDISHLVDDKRANGYRRNQLPDEVEMLTAGFDVHMHQLYYSVWGWWDIDGGVAGALIAWDIVEIDMENNPAGVRDNIVEVREPKYQKLDGAALPVPGAAVDSGWGTGDVYMWCSQLRWLVPVKGERGDVEMPEGQEQYITSSTPITRTPKGQPLPDGVRLRNLNTGFLKKEIYQGISAGRYRFPVDVEQKVLDQINAEKMVTRRSGGRLKSFYVKKTMTDDEGTVRTVQNHYLDTAVYARAMLEVLASGMTVKEAAIKWGPKKRRKGKRSMKKVNH